jgi:hypothetical protein
VYDEEVQSPDLLEQIEAQGVGALPGRIGRYRKAKRRALDVAEYIAGSPQMRTLSQRVARCGEYLLFRHYADVDQVRLHAAVFCKKHLLCPLCAIRRGAKAMQAYLPRYDALCAADGALRPYLVTLTVKDGANLAERYGHLHEAQRELWMHKHRGRGSSFDGVQAAVWSYEVKRGKGSGLWHPHLHMVAMCRESPDQSALSAEWQGITGDSHIVDVRPICLEDPASGFLEVFKYALKFSDMRLQDTVEAFQTLARRRMVGSAGLFRGIEIPEQLTDEPLDDLPYVQLFFRWIDGGYSLHGVRDI